MSCPRPGNNFAIVPNLIDPPQGMSRNILPCKIHVDVSLLTTTVFYFYFGPDSKLHQYSLTNGYV